MLRTESIRATVRAGKFEGRRRKEVEEGGGGGDVGLLARNGGLGFLEKKILALA